MPRRTEDLPSSLNAFLNASDSSSDDAPAPARRQPASLRASPAPTLNRASPAPSLNASPARQLLGIAPLDVSPPSSDTSDGTPSPPAPTARPAPASPAASVSSIASSRLSELRQKRLDRAEAERKQKARKTRLWWEDSDDEDDAGTGSARGSVTVGSAAGRPPASPAAAAPVNPASRWIKPKKEPLPPPPPPPPPEVEVEEEEEEEEDGEEADVEVEEEDVEVDDGSDAEESGVEMELEVESKPVSQAGVHVDSPAGPLVADKLTTDSLSASGPRDGLASAASAVLPRDAPHPPGTLGSALVSDESGEPSSAAHAPASASASDPSAHAIDPASASASDPSARAPADAEATDLSLDYPEVHWSSFEAARDLTTVSRAVDPQPHADQDAADEYSMSFDGSAVEDDGADATGSAAAGRSSDSAEGKGLRDRQGDGRESAVSLSRSLSSASDLLSVSADQERQEQLLGEDEIDVASTSMVGPVAPSHAEVEKEPVVEPESSAVVKLASPSTVESAKKDLPSTAVETAPLTAPATELGKSVIESSCEVLKNEERQGGRSAHRQNVQSAEVESNVEACQLEAREETSPSGHDAGSGLKEAPAPAPSSRSSRHSSPLRSRSRSASVSPGSTPSRSLSPPFRSASAPPSRSPPSDILATGGSLSTLPSQTASSHMTFSDFLALSEQDEAQPAARVRPFSHIPRSRLPTSSYRPPQDPGPALSFARRPPSAASIARLATPRRSALTTSPTRLQEPSRPPFLAGTKPGPLPPPRPVSPIRRAPPSHRPKSAAPRPESPQQLAPFSAPNPPSLLASDSAELARLHAVVAAQQDDLHALHATLLTKVTENDSLRGSIAFLEAERERLLEREAENEAGAPGSRDRSKSRFGGGGLRMEGIDPVDVTRIEREIEEQETLIRGYQIENEKLVDQLKEVKRELKAQEARHRLKTESLTRELATLRLHLSDPKSGGATGATSSTALAALETTQDALRAALHATEVRCADLEAETGRLTAALESERRSRDTEHESLRRERDALRERCNRLAVEAEAAGDDGRAALVRELVDCRRDLARLRDAETSPPPRPTASKTTARTPPADSAPQENTRRVRDLEKKVAQLAEALALARTDTGRRGAAVAAGVEMAEKEYVAIMRDRVRKLEVELDVVKVEADDRVRRMEAEHARITSALKALIQDLETSLDHTTEQRQALEQKAADLSARLSRMPATPVPPPPPVITEEALAALRAAHARSLDRALQAVDRAKRQRDAARDECARREDRIEVLEARVEALGREEVERVFEVEEGCKAMREEIERRKGEIEELKSRLGISEATRQAVHDATVSLLRQTHKDTSQISLLAHERALAALRAELRDAQADHDAKEVSAEVAKLRARLADRDAALAHAVADAKAARREKAPAGEDLDALRTECDALREDLAAARRGWPHALDTLAARVRELEVGRAAREEAAGRLEAERRRLVDIIAKKDEEIEGFRGEMGRVLEGILESDEMCIQNSLCSTSPLTELRRDEERSRIGYMIYQTTYDSIADLHRSAGVARKLFR
ncbi:hypothetical protein BDK51DRAFT_28418 [Blyttiomyces helicus]|uniref:Uncharacterized protein n=1 Tax=Blyttiomyces helicus TaxID=388810 RepID=A0A4V1IRV4_9FUNG|nr:hypothetical protein BDK51DRAFT_28418 [Blyttiomyces helicus]|eukprot:RKO91367.1 hypothetical protein BDK51DRAFT_28418 [Blyttiomyces helicus]